MSRKVLAIVLAASMAFGGSLAAFAEDATEGAAAQSMTIDFMNDEVTMGEDTAKMEDIFGELYEGTWVTIGDLGFDLYLPNEWQQVDLSQIEGAEESGVVFSAMDAEKGWNVVVSANQLAQETTAEAILAELSATDGYEDVAQLNLNEINAVTFENKTSEKPTSGVAFLSGDLSVLYTVQCGPSDDDAFEGTAGYILASVSESVAEAETE